MQTVGAVTVDLKFSPDSVDGEIHLGGDRCVVPVHQKRPCFWSAYVDTPEVQAVVNLEPSTSPVEIDLLKVAPECMATAGTPPALAILKAEVK